MAEIDIATKYSDLEDTFRRALNKKYEPPRDFGELGYEVIQGLYTVVSPRPDRFYVTMRDGTFREIPHRGKVPPVPRMPVEIRYLNDDKENDRDGYINGVDESRIKAFTENPEMLNTIGLHSHHRGSGMEFPIDLRLLWQLKGSISSGMIVTIQPGFYFTSDGLKWFSGASVDFTSNRPAAVSYKRWCVVGIKPSDNTVIKYDGTPVPSAVTLSESSIPSIAVAEPDFVYLFAVQLFQNRSSLTEMDFVALYHIAQPKSGVAVNYKVKVSDDDTTPAFLASKLTAGDNITLTVLNNGANETVSISVSGVLPTSAIPNLDANKITSGVFDVARIPALPYVDSFDIAGNSGTGTITDGETFGIIGSTGISTSVSGNNVTISGTGGAINRRLSADLTIPDGYSMVVSDYFDENGFTLTLQGDAMLEIL